VSGLDLAALITGIAGVITAAGGIFLAVRAVRSKERKAAKSELDGVEDMLGQERKERIEAEKELYRLRLRLVQHGIEANGDDTEGLQ